MEQNLRLANAGRASERRESNKLAMSLGRASAVTAAKMLDFVREMSLGSEDFTQRQSDFWIFALQRYPPKLIEEAFHQWVRKSKHMPVPSEIIEILDSMLAAERREAVAKETTRYLNELRGTREKLAAEGLPYGDAQVHSILKKAAEIVKRFPEVPSTNRSALKERLCQSQQIRRKPVRREDTTAQNIDRSG